MEADDSGAPGRLAIVQDLANSFDLRRGRDELATAEDAARWLAVHGLVESVPGLAKPDLERMHELRAALRGLLLANNGQPQRGDDLDVLNAAIRRSGLWPRVTRDGSARVVNPGHGFLFGLGEILIVVLDAIGDGTWGRLKACPGDACNYAFYDRSRNSSRTWCSMDRCGSRSKMRAYRTRRSKAVAN